jgi:hypothetical protein
MAPREHEHLRIGGVTLGAAAAPEANGFGLSRLAQASRLSPARPPRRSGWTYFGQAAIHPSNVLLLIGVMFLSLILWNVPVLLIGLGMEGAFLALVPRSRHFQLRIDEMLDDAERALAAKAREALVLQMGDAHRQELARLEALVGKTAANVERQGGAASFAAPEPDRMGRLTSSYIRLAIAYKACEESLAMTNRHLIEGSIRSLEAAEMGSPERTRGLVRRRLSIAHRRAECWTRTRDNLEAIAHQLATITELVHLMHQESLVQPDPAGVGEVIDHLLTDFEESAGALRELAEIASPEHYDLCELGGEAILTRRL